jgi:hypothetical protein
MAISFSAAYGVRRLDAALDPFLDFSLESKETAKAEASRRTPKTRPLA